MDKELTAVKSYLRIDADIDSEDDILRELIAAAHLYIETSTGKKYVPDNPLMQMLVKMLVSHWYTNRNAMNGKSNAAEYPHTITTILGHIQISSDYERR